MDQPTHPANRPALELRLVDPARGRARRYRIEEGLSLFGQPALLITWGRIGVRPRVRLETFVNAAELAARCDELLARRSAHGYVTDTGRARLARSA